jgi:predicted nucleic acid-binding Zn ribbon protein
MTCPYRKDAALDDYKVHGPYCSVKTAQGNYYCSEDCHRITELERENAELVAKVHRAGIECLVHRGTPEIDKILDLLRGK